MNSVFSDLGISQNLVAEFCNKRGISLLVLFGSRSSSPHDGATFPGGRPASLGKARPTHDIDLAIRLEARETAEGRGPSTAHEPDFLSLTYDLSAFLGHRAEVDLTILNELTPYVLRNEIFSNGKPLFEKQPGLFIEEKVRAWLLYQDSRHLFSRHHRTFMSRFFKRSHGS